jgi:hypothetical protein
MRLDDASAQGQAQAEATCVAGSALVGPNHPASRFHPHPAPRPDGWTEETQGKYAEPDYATVFPQDAVNRIDLTIAAHELIEAHVIGKSGEIPGYSFTDTNTFDDALQDLIDGVEERNIEVQLFLDEQ